MFKNKRLLGTAESEKTTEAYLSKQVVLELKGLSFKWLSTNHAGVPDRICLCATAYVFFVEVKSEGEKPSKLQLKVHEMIRFFGFNVYVVDTKAEVDNVIRVTKRILEERRARNRYNSNDPECRRPKCEDPHSSGA